MGWRLARFPGHPGDLIVATIAETPILEVRDVTVARGKATILDRVFWVVLPGEHWANLSGAFGANVRLWKQNSRYSLEVDSASDSSVL